MTAYYAWLVGIAIGWVCGRAYQLDLHHRHPRNARRIELPPMKVRR